MAMKASVEKFQCKRCLHSWAPRKEEVRICPKCKSAYWDKERKTNKKNSN